MEFPNFIEQVLLIKKFTVAAHMQSIFSTLQLGLLMLNMKKDERDLVRSGNKE